MHPYFPLPQRAHIHVLERIPPLNRVLTSLDSLQGKCFHAVHAPVISFFNLEMVFPLAVQGVPYFLCSQVNKHMFALLFLSLCPQYQLQMLSPIYTWQGG